MRRLVLVLAAGFCCAALPAPPAAAADAPRPLPAGAGQAELALHCFAHNFNYWFFSLEAGYRSPSLLADRELRLAVTFRAWGVSFFRFQPGVQELAAGLELYTPSLVAGPQHLSFYASAGNVLWFSTRTGQAVWQPLAGGGLRWRWRALEARLPAVFRFYSDGWACALRPELGLEVGAGWRLVATLEKTVLSRYDFSRAESRGQLAFGADVRW